MIDFMFKLTRFMAVTLLVLTILEGKKSVLGQSFNVDFGAQEVPNTSYGAAAEQSGFWNSIGDTKISQPLIDIFGQPTSVKVHQNNVLHIVSLPKENPREFGVILNDYIVSGREPIILTITGLENGSYELVTYAFHRGGRRERKSKVYVNNELGTSQLITNSQTPEELELFVTHSFHQVDVNNNELIITVGADIDPIDPLVNGFQLVQLVKQDVPESSTNLGSALGSFLGDIFFKSKELP